MAANAVSGPHGRDPTGADAPMVAEPAAINGPVTFHDVLEAINPLQYVPVVGTIYRAITGETGSPPLRTAASLVGGFITGGPVGVFTSILGALAEQAFHLDELARDLFGTIMPSTSRESVAAASRPEMEAALSAYGRAAAWGGPR